MSQLDLTSPKLTPDVAQLLLNAHAAAANSGQTDSIWLLTPDQIHALKAIVTS